MNQPPEPAAPAIDRRRRRVYIAIVLAFWVLVACGIRLAYPPFKQGLQPVLRGRWLVEDDELFVRPAEGFSAEWTLRSIDGARQRSYRMQHVEHDIVRHELLGPAPGRPLVLLIGDSQMYGNCDVRENTAYRLEETLRRRPGFERATVVNASCPYWSMVQYLRRARGLWDELRPDVLVIVVFAGNDLLELEDVRRPHLDDAGRERPPDSDPPPETTSARSRLFTRTAPLDYRELFGQGINQAIYFHQHPERIEPVLDKARRAMKLMRDLCRERGAGFIVGVLPSYDDFVDYQLPFALDASIAPTRDEQISRRFRADLAGMLTSEDVRYADFWEALRRSHDADVYSGDFHVGPPGHAIIADVLAPLVVEALSDAATSGR